MKIDIEKSELLLIKDGLENVMFDKELTKKYGYSISNPKIIKMRADLYEKIEKLIIIMKKKAAKKTTVKKAAKKTTVKKAKKNKSTKKTWNEFIKGRMSSYMEKYGSHGNAMKQFGKEWKQYKRMNDRIE